MASNPFPIHFIVKQSVQPGIDHHERATRSGIETPLHLPAGSLSINAEDAMRQISRRGTSRMKLQANPAS